MRALSSLLLLLALSLGANAQSHSILLTPRTIAGVSGLQSFAFGTSGDYWLLLGGRKDGLHRRQPWASFDGAGQHNQVQVVDPIQGMTWTASIASLPSGIQDQLKSTNLQFIQRGNTLYLMGGYGLSSAGGHTTFNRLTAVDVPGLVSAIVNGQPIASHFRSITHADFAVTGGQWLYIDNQHYLVGGHTFIGSYNPMGPNHGPGFTQTYADRVNIFDLIDDGTTLQYVQDTVYTDGTLLHKRDFNAVPVSQGGVYGLYALSGVFQPNVNLPWTDAVYIDASGFNQVPNFTQYFNHYHSAKIAIHYEAADAMNYYLLGGMAQYYMSNGVRLQDNDVPFVKTISLLEVSPNTPLAEIALNVEMPDYLGAGAEFIPLSSVPHDDNHMIYGDSLQGDTVLLGHMIGGINSSAPNIFFINDGNQSSASSVIYEVYLVPHTIGVPEFPDETWDWNISPNPAQDKLIFNIQSDDLEEMTIAIIDLNGVVRVERPVKSLLNDGTVSMPTLELPSGTYTIRLSDKLGRDSVQRVTIIGK